MTCLLFDNDGTLVESELICCKAIAERYKTEKDLDLDHKQLFQRFRGWELERILTIIQAEHGVSWDDGFVKRYRRNMTKLFESELQTIEGVPDALKQLPQPKAVVSNGPLTKIQNTLRITQLDHFFGDNLVSAYDIHIWKPDPGIYLHAAKILDTRPEDCIVIEDSLTGVEAAVNANMQVLFFNQHKDECSFANVTQFDSMKELPSLVNRIA